LSAHRAQTRAEFYQERRGEGSSRNEENQGRGRSQQSRLRKPISDHRPPQQSPDREAFAATALAGHIGIAKPEFAHQAFLDEIDGRAGNHAQSLVRDNDFQAVVFEHVVTFGGLADNPDLVGPTRTAGATHIDAQADAALPGHELAHAFSRSVGQGNAVVCHFGFSCMGHVQYYCGFRICIQ
jgi:hypothetical protein